MQVGIPSARSVLSAAETLEQRRRVLGADHAATIQSLYNLADVLNQQGRYGEAEPLAREVLAIRESLLGPDDAAVALAALTSGAYEPAADERVGVLLCGGNADVDWFT